MFNLPHTVKRSVLLDAPASPVWEAVTHPDLLSEGALRLTLGRLVLA